MENLSAQVWRSLHPVRFFHVFPPAESPPHPEVMTDNEANFGLHLGSLSDLTRCSHPRAHHSRSFSASDALSKAFGPIHSFEAACGGSPSGRYRLSLIDAQKNVGMGSDDSKQQKVWQKLEEHASADDGFWMFLEHP